MLIQSSEVPTTKGRWVGNNKSFFIMSRNRPVTHPRRAQPRRRVGGKTSTAGCLLVEGARSEGRRAVYGV